MNKFLLAACAAAAAVAATPSLAVIYTGAGLTITDNTTMTSTINVGSDFSVQDMSFTLNNLTHSFMGDLRATISHNGATVTWLNQLGGPRQLNGNYTISDSGSTTLGSNADSPQPPGVYDAFSPLAAFAGMSAQGAWTLSISDLAGQDVGALGSWSLDLPTAATLGAGFPITDNSTHSSVITLATLGRVTDVQFSLDGFTHTYLSDLTGTLSHGGVTVSFLNRSGGASDLDGNYLITDLGAQTLGAGSAPLRPSGAYLANSPLSAFDGLDAAGDWTLTISDLVTFDVGALSAWQLFVATDAGAVPEPSSWAMMIMGFGLIGGAVRRRKATEGASATTLAAGMSPRAGFRSHA